MINIINKKSKGKRVNVWIDQENLPLHDRLIEEKSFSRFVNDALRIEAQFEVEILKLRKDQLEQRMLEQKLEIENTNQQIKIAQQIDEKRREQLANNNKTLPIRPF